MTGTRHQCYCCQRFSSRNHIRTGDSESFRLEVSRTARNAKTTRQVPAASCHPFPVSHGIARIHYLIVMIETWFCRIRSGKVNHFAKLLIILPNLPRRGGNRWRRGRASAPMLLELAREVRLLVIAQTRGGFLDGRSVAQEFDGLNLSFFSQPNFGWLPHVFDEVLAQSFTGHAAEFGQRTDGPIGLPGKFSPVLNFG